MIGAGQEKNERMQSTFYLEAGESGSSLKNQEKNVDPNQLMKRSMKKDGIREETRWDPPGSLVSYYRFYM